MNTHAPKHRFYAWVLLLTLCAQRVVGLAGSDIAYAIEIESRMTPAEQAIAEKIHSETGLDFQVEIHDDDQVNFLMELGYAAPFLLTDDTDGQIRRYTVRDSPSTTVELVNIRDERPDSQVPLNPVRAAKDRLIADFCFWISTIELSTTAVLHLPGTTQPAFPEQPFLAILSPPPQWV